MQQRQSWIYALPALPLALPTMVLFIYLPTLYVEEFGLSLALVGTLLMLARLSDLVIDPWVGRLNDNLSTTQQRQLMLIGAALCGVGLFWLTRPISGWSASSLLLSLSILYFGWTLVQIPYLALLPGLSTNSRERTQIASLREGMGVVGLLFSAAFPVFLINGGSSTLEALRQLSDLSILLVALTLGLLLTKLHWPERITPSNNARWLSLWRNRPARVLMFAWFSNGLANGIPAVLFPLYITEVLKLDEAARANYILIYFICAILSLPLWWLASQRISRKRLWQVAMLIALICFLPASLLGPSDANLFMLICMLTGAMLGADLALPQALQADVCDWHRFRFKRDQSASLFAIWNVFTKLALAFAALVAFGLLDLSGFDQDTNQVGLLALIYAFLPCVLKLLAILMMEKFTLSEAQHTEIIARIERREDV